MSKHRSFEEWLKDFEAYKKDGRVKRKFVTQEGHRLGNWMHGIDENYEMLSEEKKIALEAAGYVRPKRGRPPLNFAESFEIWKQYQVNGDLSVRFVAPNGHRTGLWVQYVRRGIIEVTEEQKRQLNDAGFKWHSVRGRKKKK